MWCLLDSRPTLRTVRTKRLPSGTTHRVLMQFTLPSWQLPLSSTATRILSSSSMILIQIGSTKRYTHLVLLFPHFWVGFILFFLLSVLLHSCWCCLTPSNFLFRRTHHFSFTLIPSGSTIFPHFTCSDIPDIINHCPFFVLVLLYSLLFLIFTFVGHTSLFPLPWFCPFFSLYLRTVLIWIVMDPSMLWLMTETGHSWEHTHWRDQLYHLLSSGIGGTVADSLQHEKLWKYSNGNHSSRVIEHSTGLSHQCM